MLGWVMIVFWRAKRRVGRMSKIIRLRIFVMIGSGGNF